ncbi:hypothetical protein CMUS01_09940 [Colletotrichum musicola]|uniref:Uncharacterized protein n=1 Tax=Colletotrichum musicola TaxID=2175873 RepID=A0A8H6N9B2_9PEZI|nr:hypothetical protein CMUS01_09940 [Colletotrichum musicola]
MDDIELRQVDTFAGRHRAFLCVLSKIRQLASALKSTRRHYPQGFGLGTGNNLYLHMAATTTIWPTGSKPPNRNSTLADVVKDMEEDEVPGVTAIHLRPAGRELWQQQQWRPNTSTTANPFLERHASQNRRVLAAAAAATVVAQNLLPEEACRPVNRQNLSGGGGHWVALSQLPVRWRARGLSVHSAAALSDPHPAVVPPDTADVTALSQFPCSRTAKMVPRPFFLPLPRIPGPGVEPLICSTHPSPNLLVHCFDGPMPSLSSVPDFGASMTVRPRFRHGVAFFDLSQLPDTGDRESPRPEDLGRTLLLAGLTRSLH